MATEIHHGPPGSFKSFALVYRFLIAALQAGRVVVSNIRGIEDIETIKDAFPDLDFPSSAYIIFVDTTVQAGRTALACFYKWVPFGALILIDEIQQIYPDRRDFKLESLDAWQPHPHDVFDDRMIGEGRPEDVFTAYDKQRHYNWDIYASTTNIAKVKREIREVTDFAYRHRNLSGFLPWWHNKWIETCHDPENNGKSKAHTVGTPKRYTADPRYFKCYKSTATGEHTQGGRQSILLDPKILAFLVLICLCGLFFMAMPSGSSSVKKTADTRKAPDQIIRPGNPPANDPNADGRLDGQRPPPSLGRVVLASLTIETIREWSANGVKREELATLPATCQVFKKHIRCPIKKHTQADFTAVATSTSRVCERHNCVVYFPVIQPPPEPLRNEVKPSFLASSLIK